MKALRLFFGVLQSAARRVVWQVVALLAVAKLFGYAPTLIGFVSRHRVPVAFGLIVWLTINHIASDAEASAGKRAYDEKVREARRRRT